MKKQYRSRLMASLHETAEGLHDAGVMDKITLRQFDELCLTPVSYSIIKFFIYYCKNRRL
jgi:putative transcriptional regulator